MPKMDYKSHNYRSIYKYKSLSNLSSDKYLVTMVSSEILHKINPVLLDEIGTIL